MARDQRPIRVGDDVAAVISVFDVDYSRQQQLGDLLGDGAGKVIGRWPGFASAKIPANDAASDTARTVSERPSPFPTCRIAGSERLATATPGM
jgi:hypothetical protein